MIAGFRVVRFAGTGVREYHNLAFCMPSEDNNETTLIYADRKVTCAQYLLKKSVHVNVQNMLDMAHVRATIDRDRDALFEALRGEISDHAHAQVCTELDEQIGRVHAAVATQTIARRSRAVAQSITVDTADAAIGNFKSTSSTERLQSISSNITHFRTTSQALMPTSWVKTAPIVKGMQSIDLTKTATMRRVTVLCKRQQIKPPSGFVRSHSFHYGKYEKSKLVSFLSLSVANMNHIPGSIVIAIDIAVSKDNKHSMTVAIDSIKKMMRKRRNKCVLFAQIAQTESARTFWAGKLTKTKRASVIAALLSEFDKRYLIYEDADDMAMFYE